MSWRPKRRSTASGTDRASRVPLVVVLDACVLHPAPLRDLLIRLDLAGMVRARWSERIMEECFASILDRRPDLAPDALDRTRELMKAAIPDWEITGFEDLIEDLELPDPDDRHVLAAAIRGSAQIIVTSNLKDFPSAALAAHGVEAQHPDDFILERIEEAPALVAQVLMEQAAALKNPPCTIEDVLTALQDAGLVRSVARLRDLRGGS